MSEYVQTTYGTEQNLGFEGNLASSYKSMLKSGASKEKIFFGRGLAKFGTGYKTIAAEKVTFSADFSASNVISGNVTLISVDSNGVQTSTTTAIAPVTYASSHASTLAAVVTAIEAITNVNAAGTASSGREITVAGESGYMVALSGFAVAGGSAVTVTYSTGYSFDGVSVADNKEPDSNGDTYYKPKETLNIAKENELWVKVDAAVTPTTVPYVRIVAAGGTNQALGQFTTSANASVSVSLAGLAEYMGTTSGAGIVQLALLNV
jgi:hypothetical protein